ncbi:MAG: LPS assembly protein LptD [Chthoniobacterales bacterium]|nr:LPS assembly protein LptD [Chthoniobacterales bacterium]
MRPPVFLLLLLLAPCSAMAEPLKGPGSLPVEINSTGQTTYENGLATARDNVSIHFGDTDIYSDFAQYDSAKRSLFLKGNVRIYRGISLYIGKEAVYNLDTKAIQAHDMRSGTFPYLVAGENIESASDAEYKIQHGSFTTDDVAQPDFQLKATGARIYPDDRVIFRNVTLYVGKVPIFWMPYLYQPLDQSFSYAIAPAYLSSWGPSLLGKITFPIGEKISATVRLDYRSRRGEAIGFDSIIHYGKNDTSDAKINTYYLQDQNPNLNQASVPRGGIPTARYRFTLRDRTRLTDDLEVTADITKLSDAFLLQDFFIGESRVDPQPDSNVAVTLSGDNYTLTGYARYQLNSFFETTERLPEIDFDLKRQPLFGGPIFYEGETSAAQLHRNFPTGSVFQDYSVFRVDTFHQLTYPGTYFGWLSLVPRIGFRETYYSQTRDLGKTIFPITPSDPLAPEFPIDNPTTATTGTGANPLFLGGETFRSVFNAGLEASFKVSREWEQVQTRALGLDGLRHIVQPYFNFSYVSNPTANPLSILQFDRFQPSTKLEPLDFPQYTSIDSLDNWTIARLGVRNRLQTRRDDYTVSWLELDTYFDVNIDNPFDRTQFSNVFNKLAFTPVPWATLEIDSQIPLLDKGFTEVDTSIRFQPSANTQFTIGHRYLNNNPFFLNSSLYTIGGYYRINDNWGVGATEQYEATTHVLEQQRYEVYRDLSSWVASVGGIIRDNGGVKEYGVLLTFTLKAFPKLNFDLNFDPAGTNQTQ